MSVLSAEAISKSYSEKPLFENFYFSINEGQKTALIAANGSGKTTLMRILAGKEPADSGNITRRKDFTVGYLEQETYFDEELSVVDSLFFSDDIPVLKLLGEYERELEKGEDSEQLHKLIEQIDAHQAWNYETQIHEVLGKLGIHDLDKQVKLLSGGQRKRLALARLLIHNADILLLDEPTNHLDLDMIEWLENYLKNLNKSMLIISHDRYFIDVICNTIIELDRGVLSEYKGNYAYYLEKKNEREMAMASELDKAQNLYRRELEWMRRQPKARSTKQKARIDSFYKTEDKVSQRQSSDKINLTMNMERLGSKILEFEHVVKSYGDKAIVKDFSYTFKRGERIGIVGKNGVGKSTFLNMIMEKVKPDKGKIRSGETVVFGYFAQEGLKLENDKRVIDVARDIAEYVDMGKGKWLGISQFLNHFLFPPSKQQTYVSKLSGGEKRRLHLLTVLLGNPNFLILDEPTNDLDIVTLNTLEEFLENYGGCMLMVTHDRYFMDRLVDHIFVFEGDGVIKDINGNYTDYKEEQAEERKNKKTEAKAAKEKPVKDTPVKVKRSFKEKQEFEKLENEIALLELRKNMILEKMNSGISDHTELQKVSDEYAAVSDSIEKKTLRWMELAEMGS